MPRVFRFVDILGCELHTINDPEDKLPIPQTRQIISIGLSSMLVQSVSVERSVSSGRPSVYIISVRELPIATGDQLFKN
jgi:hypothetical protein